MNQTIFGYNPGAREGYIGRRWFLASGWLVALLCGCPLPGHAADNPIQVTTRAVTTKGKTVHARVMKIRMDQVRFVVGLAHDQVGATEEMAAIPARHNAIAAINGCFFEAYIKDKYKRPDFTLIHDGKVVNDELFGTILAFGPKQEVRMTAVRDVRRLIGTDDPFWGGVQEAIACGPRLLTDGKITVDPAREGFSDSKVLMLSAGRSAIGITADGSLLLVISRGTIRELAQQMKDLGAVQAMNLDGGASSGLWLRGKYLVKPGRLISNVLMVMGR